jgi:hypothetical protein
MSTTIESRGRRGLRFFLAASVVLAVWFSMVALATLVAEPTRSVVVFAPAPDALRALAHSDALIVGGGTGYVIAQGQYAGFVRALYAGGAWLVLPALTGGCRGMPRSEVTASMR